MTRPLQLKNAFVWDGDSIVQRDLYTQNGRIVASPAHDALVVNLEGYTIFPGLINAHDHLELNHFPRTKFREVYNNAHEWGEDVNARLNDEPFKTLRSYPLWDRVFIGGLKNLLCGATTVVHHGPPHQPMFRKDFPVRVLRRYGWAHSLHFNTEDEIIRSYRSTPKDVPWFIHLAEGTDEIAAGEYQRLKKLGCVGENTVIVHGVGFSIADIHELTKSKIPLIWCPSTNLYLLNQTASTDEFRASCSGTVLLGSDSRLTARGDLLDELGIATTAFSANGLHYEHEDLINMVTANVCQVNGLKHLYSGDVADLVALPSDIALIHSLRADLSVIMRDGIPHVGKPDLMAKFPQIQTVACTLDGVEKRIHIDLARQIHRCTLKEPGLEVDALPQNRFWLF